MKSLPSVPHRLARWAFRAALLVACMLAVGCLDEDTGEEECTPMPLFCDRSRPTQADLEILTGGGTLRKIEVRSGSAFETGTPVWSGTSGGTIRLPLGDYSARAIYVHGGDSVFTFDGDDLDYSSSEYCEGTCYDEDGGTVDLRLE